MWQFFPLYQETLAHTWVYKYERLPQIRKYLQQNA
jgi:hypothetical protein